MKFNKEKIKNFIQEHYNIFTKKIKYINRGTANLFKIYSLNNKKYVFKIFQEHYTTIDIMKECAIFKQLTQDGIKTSEIVPNINNEYYSLFNDRICTVQFFIDGKIYNNNCGNKFMLKESAEYLAKIVNSLKKLPKFEVFDMSNLFCIDTLDIAIIQAKTLISNVKPKNKLSNKMYEDVLYKIAILEKLKNFDLSKFKNYTVTNSHGDYNVLQFIYNNNKIKAIIDFVASKSLPISWELIRSYSILDVKCKNGVFNMKNFINYVNSFNKICPLKKEDLFVMPYLYLFQLSKSLFGYKQYFKGTADKKLIKFAIFRTKIIRYLFKNADLISNVLLEKVKVVK